MVFFLSEQRLKADLLHENVGGEYIRPSMITAHTIYLKELIGDSLYNTLEKAVENQDVKDQYKELLDNYIIPFLEFTVMAELTMNVAFKFRNLGIVNTSDVNAAQVGIEQTKYFQNYYHSKSEYYANRVKRFLTLNREKFPEYTECGGCEQVTAPKNSTYGGLWLN